MKDGDAMLFGDGRQGLFFHIHEAFGRDAVQSAAANQKQAAGGAIEMRNDADIATHRRQCFGQAPHIRSHQAEVGGGLGESVQVEASKTRTSGGRKSVESGQRTAQPQQPAPVSDAPFAAVSGALAQFARAGNGRG